METTHLKSGSIKPPLQKEILRCYSMKFCPYSQRTLLVLQAKNIRHEVVFINLKDKPEWFKELTPLGSVPVLEKDGKTIVESVVGMEFLEDLYEGRSLYHKDPWERYHDRGFLDVFNSKVISSLSNLLYSREGDRPEMFERTLKGLEIFEIELKNREKKFFVGQKPGFLDYGIWPWLERIPALQLIDNLKLPEDRFPVLTTYINEMMTDGAVQEIYIEPKYHVKILKAIREGQPLSYDMLTNQKLKNFAKY